MAKQTIPNASLDSLIEPRNFDLIVDTAKQLSTDKEWPVLNVGCTSRTCSSFTDNGACQSPKSAVPLATG